MIPLSFPWYVKAASANIFDKLTGLKEATFRGSPGSKIEEAMDFKDGYAVLNFINKARANTVNCIDRKKHDTWVNDKKVGAYNNRYDYKL